MLKTVQESNLQQRATETFVNQGPKLRCPQAKKVGKYWGGYFQEASSDFQLESPRHSEKQDPVFSSDRALEQNGNKGQESPINLWP